MYNIFRKLPFFNKKTKVQEEESSEELSEEPAECELVSLKISYNKDLDVDISCIWDEDTDESCFMLADLLYKLDSGVALTYISNVLIRHISQNPSDTMFVTKAFSMYETMKKNGEGQQPLVRPSDVFREIQQ